MKISEVDVFHLSVITEVNLSLFPWSILSLDVRGWRRELLLHFSRSLSLTTPSVSMLSKCIYIYMCV